jgi:hydrogenase 3 maturation protease
MSNPSWSEQLRQSLRRLPTDRPPRVAVVGVGQELNGDDGAGLAVARALGSRLGSQDWLLIVEAGSAPENQTGRLRAFGPDLVLFVDAAQMGAAPGTVRLLPWQATTGLSASTHTLPLHILARFLTHDLGCDVALLGLQPHQNRVDAPLSDAMREVVDRVVDDLAALLLA